MIRSANHSSFPKRGDHPMNAPLNEAREALAANEIDEAAWLNVVDETTTLAVAEQARAFVEVVTDGQIGWVGPHAQLAAQTDGLSLGSEIPWLAGDLNEPQLIVDGPLKATGSICRRTYDVADHVAITQLLKVSLPGPVALARRADDRHYGDLDKLADAFAERLAAEVRELSSAGATAFQLDEPLLCQHPDDLERVIRTATTVFAAIEKPVMTILSTFFGDIDALAADWGRLPGTHLGLEALDASANLAALDKLPENKGVYLGVFDVRNPEEEDADDVVTRLSPYQEALVKRDVVVGPNGGTELLERDVAFDKLLHARYVAEALTKDWDWPEA